MDVFDRWMMNGWMGTLKKSQFRKAVGEAGCAEENKNIVKNSTATSCTVHEQLRIDTLTSVMI